MKSLTEKQRQFAINKAAGVRNRDAAIAAGFSPRSADVQAAQLLKREDIKKAIAQAKRDFKKGTAQAPHVPEEEQDDTDKKKSMPKSRYTDPLEFLTDVMNHKHLPIVARADAAFKMLPYMHARIGEKGKKQTAKDRAAEIASGGGQPASNGETAGKRRSKYQPKAAPALKVVGGTG